MAEPKRGLMVGGGLGLLALLGILTASFLPSPSAGPLEGRVEDYFHREQAEPAAGHYHDVGPKVAELEATTKDPAFARLPERTQERVRGRLKELRAYQDYEQKVNQITDPGEAQSEEQLKAIKDALAGLTIPVEYQVDWTSTDAARRHNRMVRDADALGDAEYDLRRKYRQLADAGNDVLKNADAPQLPRRAQVVLDRSRALPAPEKDKGRAVPQAETVTYAAVFRFAGVRQAYQEWLPVKEKLEKLTYNP